MLTKIGPFSVARDGPAGAPSEITDRTLTTSLTYNALGRLTRRSHKVGSNAAYRLDLAQDAVGRIDRKTETLAGSTHAYSYAYDPDVQLTARFKVWIAKAAFRRGMSKEPPVQRDPS